MTLATLECTPVDIAMSVANQDRRVYSPVVLRLPAGARGGEVGAPTAAAPTPTAYATSEERRADIRPPSSSVSSPAMARFTLDHPADDPHRPRLTGRLNWLRAGILGANDGIVSVASIVVGVAAAANETGLILTAGAAALVGGAVSMALGEYVSVSSQRDTERSLIARQRLELETMPADELAELAHVYEARGLSPDTARLVAREMTAHDPLATHLEVQFGIDQGDLGVDRIVVPHVCGNFEGHRRGDGGACCDRERVGQPRPPDRRRRATVAARRA